MMQNKAMVAGIRISRLEKLKCKTVPIMPAEFFTSGLEAQRVVRNPEGAPIWYHVLRIELIKHLKQTHSIYKKREINVRNSLRK